MMYAKTQLKFQREIEINLRWFLFLEIVNERRDFRKKNFNSFVSNAIAGRFVKLLEITAAIVTQYQIPFKCS